ncbi:hypothetical protein B7P43_G08649, partial [Cryptotermes secundus]
LGTPFFPGAPELWHHPLAYSAAAAAAAELPGAALQHATLVHPALHPQVPHPLSIPHPTAALTSIHASLPHFLPSPALASPVGSSSSQPGVGVNNAPCSTLFVANLGQFVSEHELKEIFSRELLGSVVVSCCCEKLVAQAGDSSGTQRKGNVLRWKQLSNNGIDDVIVDTSVFPGFCRLRMHTKGGSPVAFVEYQDVRFAAQAMTTLQGSFLLSSDRGAIRIEYAKSKMAEVGCFLISQPLFCEISR